MISISADVPSLATLPAEIIRRIIPESNCHRLRLINRRWDALVREYHTEKKKPIDSVTITPGDHATDDMQIEVTVAPQYLCFFGAFDWKKTGFDASRNVVRVISPPQRILNRLGDQPFAFKPIMIIGYFTLLCLYFIYYILRGITFSITTFQTILFFHGVGVQAYNQQIHNDDGFINLWWLRAAEKLAQKYAGNRATTARNRLEKLMESCSRIGVLRVIDLDLWTFDALLACLGEVQIGKLEIRLKSWKGWYPNFEDDEYIRTFHADIKKLAWKHGVVNGVVVNGRTIFMHFNHQ